MSEPDRNLIMLYRPRLVDPQDFEEIGQRVRAMAPDIAVHVMSNDLRRPIKVKRLAERPTFVFSPTRMREFRPARGKIYHGNPLPKMEQLRRLEDAGMPVPKWAMLEPGIALSREDWGEFVVLKPDDPLISSQGQGVQLMRTERVRYRRPEEYPDDHPGRKGPMIIQQFIDTGPRPNNWRYLSLFGETLYSYFKQLKSTRPPLDASDEELEGAVVATNGGPPEWVFEFDSNMATLAKRIHAAFPEIPLQGCDFIRDIHTSRTFVLEVNPGGNTWHFSSMRGAKIRSFLGGRARLIEQLGAFDIAARVLVERTRAEAE